MQEEGENANLAFIRRYLEAMERMVAGDELAAFYTPDAVQVEYPNKITPNTVRRSVADLLAAAERGRKVMSKQRFEVKNALASGKSVVLEMLWTGTLAIPLGTLPAGGEMKAHFAQVIEFKGGRIAAQRNYDCFEPW